MKSSVIPDLMTSAAFILAAMFLIVSGRDRTGLRSAPDESEEFSQSYSLSSGATIEVRNIPFGPVTIERSATGSAQVHVIRTARSKDELACSRVTVEHTPTKLLIRGDDNSNCRKQSTQISQQIVIKVPDQSSLVASVISGPLTIAALDGPIRVGSISQSVKLHGVSGAVDINGVSGLVDLMLTGPAPQEVRVRGVSTGVRLRLAGNLNADLNVRNVRGQVLNEAAHVVLTKAGDNNYQGKSGSGGGSIIVDGISGYVRISDN